MDSQTPDDYLRQAIHLSEEMIALASAGDACRTDAGCGIVFGSMRDKAYKVRSLAQNELKLHQESGASNADEPNADEPPPQPSTT